MIRNLTNHVRLPCFDVDQVNEIIFHQFTRKYPFYPQDTHSKNNLYRSFLFSRIVRNIIIDSINEAVDHCVKIDRRKYHVNKPKVKRFRGERVARRHEKKDAVSRTDACKIVICEPCNRYRDMLYGEYKVDLGDEFEHVKKQFMARGNCGKHVNPKALAGAIFYMLMRGKARYLGISNVIDISEPVIRGYVRILEKISLDD